MHAVLRRARDERGSAPVDFVLVGSLVTLMFLAIVQLGIDYHVRNVLAACAAEGARYGANADVASAEPVPARANELISRSVGSRFATAVAAPSQDSVDGAPVVTINVDCTSSICILNLPGGTDGSCGRSRIAGALVSGWRRDDGSALVEFTWLAILLMIPLVYVVLAAVSVQRAAFATTSPRVRPHAPMQMPGRTPKGSDAPRTP